MRIIRSIIITLGLLIVVVCAPVIAQSIKSYLLEYDVCIVPGEGLEFYGNYALTIPPDYDLADGDGCLHHYDLLNSMLFVYNATERDLYIGIRPVDDWYDVSLVVSNGEEIDYIIEEGDLYLLPSKMSTGNGENSSYLDIRFKPSAPLGENKLKIYIDAVEVE